MMGHYHRKTLRQSWDLLKLQINIKDIQREKMGYLTASKKFNVTGVTLKKRVAKTKIRIEEKHYGAKFSLELQEIS